jgi:uncharacterized protein (TIGR01777 family)
MKILITGSTGLVGTALCSFLTSRQHQVLRMVRKARTGKDEISWDPYSGTVDKKALENLDAAVHLAGESISGGRWTIEKKRRIRSSRSRGTRFLAETLASLKNPPRVLISSSAIGYYGNRGEEILTEESSLGKGFLSDVCREWEMVTMPAFARGIRVAIVRTGMVLNPTGGALHKLLPLFRMGLGGVLGDGRQYMSWIALEDLIAVIHHLTQNDSIQGPVNATAPSPVTNLEFTRTLARILARPAVFRIPPCALRLMLGEMADELLLASTRAVPARLKDSGFHFQFSGMEDALRHMLVKPAVTEKGMGIQRT